MVELLLKNGESDLISFVKVLLLPKIDNSIHDSPGSRCEANTFDGERCLYGALTDRIRRILQRYNAVSSDSMRRESYSEFLRR